MSISYKTALERLFEAADETIARQTQSSGRRHDVVPLTEAIGRVVAVDILSPLSTPTHDTSAMDGYVLPSLATCDASPQSPVQFHVSGTIAAGDDTDAGTFPLLTTDGSSPTQCAADRMRWCAEIMTGARFPTKGRASDWDACVKLEDIQHIQAGVIALTAPVPRNCNRRFAGHDIQQGQLLLRQGDVVTSEKIMVVASAGIHALPVVFRPRVGIWSTGKELASKQTSDVNGPFLTTAVRANGAAAEYLGVLDDDLDATKQALRDQAELSMSDIILTSGGVSVGRFDFVRTALEHLGARIIFHGLSIRPGHPVLFATLPSLKKPGREVAVFGLPGNPGAAAACLRFLFVPYLRHLLGQEAEKPAMARLMDSVPVAKSTKCRDEELDRFRPGILHVADARETVVQDVGGSKGPAKLSPFISSNCWIHFPPKLLDSSWNGLVPCYLNTETSTF